MWSAAARGLMIQWSLRSIVQIIALQSSVTIARLLSTACCPRYSHSLCLLNSAFFDNTSRRNTFLKCLYSSASALCVCVLAIGQATKRKFLSLRLQLFSFIQLRIENCIAQSSVCSETNFYFILLIYSYVALFYPSSPLICQTVVLQ